jgi:hypothetical protein
MGAILSLTSDLDDVIDGFGGKHALASTNKEKWKILVLVVLITCLLSLMINQ